MYGLILQGFYKSQMLQNVLPCTVYIILMQALNRNRGILTRNFWRAWISKENGLRSITVINMHFRGHHPSTREDNKEPGCCISDWYLFLGCVFLQSLYYNFIINCFPTRMLIIFNGPLLGLRKLSN